MTNPKEVIMNTKWREEIVVKELFEYIWISALDLEKSKARLCLLEKQRLRNWGAKKGDLDSTQDGVWRMVGKDYKWGTISLVILTWEGGSV
jgi:hypothetical protein